MFKIYKANEKPFEYILGTNAEAYSIGEALTLSSGRLTKASGTTAPEFICMGKQAAESTAITPICVIRVMEDMEFETTFAAAGTSINRGDKVTIHTDGLQVTATTTSGVFLVNEGAGGASGDKVTGYFRR